MHGLSPRHLGFNSISIAIKSILTFLLVKKENFNFYKI